MTSDFGTASSHFNTVYIPVSQNDRLSSELPLLEFGELCPSGDVMVESSLAKLVNWEQFWRAITRGLRASNIWISLSFFQIFCVISTLYPRERAYKFAIVTSRTAKTIMIEILKNENFENNNTLGDIFERKNFVTFFFLSHFLYLFWKSLNNLLVEVL